MALDSTSQPLRHAARPLRRGCLRSRRGNTRQTSPIQLQILRSAVAHFVSARGSAATATANPFVTLRPRDALAMPRSSPHSLRRRLQNIFKQLASSTQQVPVSAELVVLLERLSQSATDCRPTAPSKSGSLTKSARLLIACIMMRLGATPAVCCSVPGQYRAHALQRRAADPLRSHHSFATSLSSTAATALAEMLIEPAADGGSHRTGCSSQTLDIRQHARVPPQPSLRSPLQPSGVVSIIDASAGFGPKQTAEVLDTFPHHRRAQAGILARSIRQYVISGATSADDVLHVLWLARLGGVHVEASRRRSWLQPVPLFDPSRPAKRAPAIMRKLWTSEALCAAFLKSWNRHQEVMSATPIQQRRRHDHQHMGDLQGHRALHEVARECK